MPSLPQSYLIYFCSSLFIFAPKIPFFRIFFPGVAMKRDSVSNLDKKDVRRKWLVRSILSLIRFNERSMHLHRFTSGNEGPFSQITRVACTFNAIKNDKWRWFIVSSEIRACVLNCVWTVLMNLASNDGYRFEIKIGVRSLRYFVIDVTQRKIFFNVILIFLIPFFILLFEEILWCKSYKIIIIIIRSWCNSVLSC